MDVRSSFLEPNAKMSRIRPEKRYLHTLVLSALFLCMIIGYVNAGDAPSRKILDILADSQSGNVEKITVLSDAEVYYSIDETDLNQQQNPQLLIEIENASLDPALGSGLGVNVPVKRNGIVRLEAVESPQTQRVYLYIELSEPRSYRELSKSPTKRVELEIHPASGQGVRLVTSQRDQPTVVNGSTGQPTSRSTEPLGNGSTAPLTSGSRNRSTESAAQAKQVPVVQDAQPVSIQQQAASPGQIAHLYSLVYRETAPGTLHITMELDSPVQPQTEKVSQGIQVMLPGTLLTLKNLVGGDWLKPQLLAVNQNDVKQIRIQQASIDPEQVQVLIETERELAHRLLPASNPNEILLEVGSTQSRSASVASTLTFDIPQGKIEGNTILLPVGQSLTLDMTLEPADTVALGNPMIADAAPSAANSLIVNGKQRGVTNLEIRDRYNRLVTDYVVQVYEDWSWLEQQLRTELGESIQVKVRNGTVFLEGAVDSQTEAQQLERIAKAVVSDLGSVQSMLTVHSQSSEGVAQRLTSLIRAEDMPDVSVQVEGGRVILAGTVSRHTDLQRAENLARFFGDTVINSIEVQLPETLARRIESEIGMPNIQVQLADDSAVIRGVVHTTDERSHIEEIASLYVPRVANLVEVQPAHPTSEEVQNVIGLPEVIARWSGDVLVLSGNVESQLESSIAEQIAKRFAPTVMNNIRIRRQDQVNIKVRVIEINKNASSQLGVDWTRGVRFQESFIPTGKLHELYRLGQAVRLDQITAEINALIEQGRARVLVDTNLTTLSGKVAELHSGGQLPLVSSITNGQNFGTVFGEEVRQFGVQLEITPTVDDQGFITVDIHPQVSTLNEAQTVMTPAGIVPTFNSRSLEGTIRLMNGQTYAVGGVMQQQENILERKVPILGHIPLLGALFTTQRKSTDETELVFILTPTIVEPGMGNPSLDIPENPFTGEQEAYADEPRTLQSQAQPPLTQQATQTVMPRQPMVAPGPQPVSQQEPFEW